MNSHATSEACTAKTNQFLCMMKSGVFLKSDQMLRTTNKLEAAGQLLVAAARTKTAKPLSFAAFLSDKPTKGEHGPRHNENYVK